MYGLAIATKMKKTNGMMYEKNLGVFFKSVNDENLIF